MRQAACVAARPICPGRRRTCPEGPSAERVGMRGRDPRAHAPDVAYHATAGARASRKQRIWPCESTGITKRRSVRTAKLDFGLHFELSFGPGVERNGAAYGPHNRTSGCTSSWASGRESNETARRTVRKTLEPPLLFDFREPLVAISEGVCLPCSYQSRGELVVGRLVVVVSRHALTSVSHHGLHDPRRQL